MVVRRRLRVEASRLSSTEKMFCVGKMMSFLRFAMERFPRCDAAIGLDIAKVLSDSGCWDVDVCAEDAG